MAPIQDCLSKSALSQIGKPGLQMQVSISLNIICMGGIAGNSTNVHLLLLEKFTALIFWSLLLLISHHDYYYLSASLLHWFV